MDIYTQHASVWTVLKNSSYVVAFMASTQYLGLDGQSVAILAALILLDIVTGVLKSAALRGWRSIKSSRLASGTLAKLLLILIPIILAFAGKGIGMDLAVVAQSAITVLILSQVYSVIGNIHSLQTKTEKNEFDAVAFILRGIRDLLERLMVEKPKNTV